MSAPPVVIDFSASGLRTSALSVALLIVGVGALVATGVAFQIATSKRAGLELKLADALHRPAPGAANQARDSRLNAQAADIARQLGTPWTVVLAELETASRDSNGDIAVLSVEPDADKHRIRVNGESRNLPAALAYLNRLQASRSLRFPMLDSHEVVADNNEHPVRFAMTADWRESP